MRPWSERWLIRSRLPRRARPGRPVRTGRWAGVLALAGALLWLSGTTRAADGDWIAREKIRAGWIYTSDGTDRLAFFQRCGMNALITHAGNAETFTLWAKEARKVGMHLFGVVGASCDGEKAGMRRCVFANGYESVLPCPLDERYWREGLTAPAVRLADESTEADRDIAGMLIDWEMYANSAKGGQIYYTDACFCDRCFAAFLARQGQPDACGQVAFKDRVAWLKDRKLYEAYAPFLQAEVRAAAARMREQVAAANPAFFVGFYPVPHNWHLRGVAQGLGTAERPLILWATSTYGGGGPGLIADTWKQDLLADGIHAYYSGGLLLRQYSAANLAKNLYEIARKTDGYWLFTVHTLCLREEEQKGDYHLCAGTPDDYLAALRLGNRELDALAADPQHATALAYVEEPVRYRHPGFDVERFVAPALVDRSPAGRGQPMDVPRLGLIATSYLMLDLRAGEGPALVLDVTRAKSGAVWGVSYVVLGPGKEALAAGRMPPGEPFTLRFAARQPGLHTVVLTPGYYGRCQVQTTTVPYAHWTWTSYPGFEVAGPGGTLYLAIPPGLKEFTVEALCQSATAQVQLAVLDPDGQTVVERPTDPFVRSAKLTVPTHGKDGRPWALRLSRCEGKSYRSVLVRFDPHLAAAVTVRPDFVFACP